VSRRFQKRIEDFTCANCGSDVRGGGYTDHCPHCLWSRHVDVMPGDRASDCGGMMKPVEVRKQRGRYVIVYRCQRCGAVKKCRAAPEDSPDMLAEVMRRFGRCHP